MWGMTWHYMDAELDTGNLLAQGSIPVRDDDVVIDEFAPRIQAMALGLLPVALRVCDGRRPG